MKTPDYKHELFIIVQVSFSETKLRTLKIVEIKTQK